MIRLNPEKLSVQFRQGVTKTSPILGRHYTMTHSDITAELFLTIGLQYAYDKISSIRDDVLAKWTILNNSCILSAYVLIDNGQFDLSKILKRNEIFIRELPLALETLRYGDRVLFQTYPFLDKCPIFIHFQSTYPYLNRTENWGTPSDYK